MRKKSKFGFNTGNTLIHCLNSISSRRHKKDQHVIVKTLRNRLVQPVNAEDLNKKLVSSIDSLVQDGNINDGVKYKTPARPMYSWLRYDVSIVYSLNKRKRWLLPDRIEETIDQLRKDPVTIATNSGKDATENFQCDVSLVNREMVFDTSQRSCSVLKITRRNYDAVSFNSSFTPQKVYSKKTASCETDLKRKAKNTHTDQKQVAKERRRKNHNRHFRDLQRDERLPREEPENDVKVEDKPEIHYEICHPMEAPSWSYYQYREPRLKKSKKKSKGVRNKMRHHDEMIPSDLMQLAMDAKYNNGSEVYYHSESDADILEENPECLLDYRNTFDTPSQFYDLDFSRKPAKLKNEKKQKCNHLSTQLSGSTKRYGKNAVVYEMKPMGTEDKEEVEIIKDDLYLTLSDSWVDAMAKRFEVCIEVECSSMHPKDLQCSLGQAYTEGLSSPRRFSFNISQYICDKFSCDRNLNKNDELVVVCTPVIENNNTQSFDHCESGAVCPVQLSVFGNEEHTNVCSSLFPQLLTNSPGDIASFLAQLASFVHLELYGESRKTTCDIYANLPSRRMPKYSFLSELNMWNLQYFNPSQACTVVGDLPLKRQHRKYKKLGSHSVVGHQHYLDDELDIFCDICFSQVPIYSQSNVHATALSSCKHWFCHDCWRQHLVGSITSGCVSLECPSFECENVVDDATVLSLVGHVYYTKYWHRLQHLKIDQRLDWQWCPRTSCDNVVQNPMKAAAFGNSRACVECLCRLTWCFDCQAEPHWPMSCEKAEMYTQQVKQREDISKIFFVDVKKCPSCKHPINKNGGCQHMVCRCGYSFCWECLGAWSDHGSSLTCPKGRVGLTQLSLEDTSTVKMKAMYFDRAAEYRKSRKKLQYKFTKIQGRLVVLLTKIHKKPKMKKQNLIVQNHPVYSQTLDFLRKKAGFLYEALHSLEFSCAFISQTEKKSLHTLADKVDLFGLCTNIFSRCLLEDTITSVDDWRASLQKAQDCIKPQILAINKEICKIDT